LEVLHKERLAEMKRQYTIQEREFKPIADGMTAEIHHRYRGRVSEQEYRISNSKNEMAPLVREYERIAEGIQVSQNRMRENNDYIARREKSFRDESSRILQASSQNTEAANQSTRLWNAWSGNVVKRAEGTLSTSVDLRNALEASKSRLASEDINAQGIAPDSRQAKLPRSQWGNPSQPEDTYFKEVSVVMKELASESAQGSALVQQKRVDSENQELRALQAAIAAKKDLDIKAIVRTLSPSTIQRIKASSSEELKSLLGLK
jgi:hypothetical protein